MTLSIPVYFLCPSSGPVATRYTARSTLLLKGTLILYPFYRPHFSPFESSLIRLEDSGWPVSGRVRILAVSHRILRGSGVFPTEPQQELEMWLFWVKEIGQLPPVLIACPCPICGGPISAETSRSEWVLRKTLNPSHSIAKREQKCYIYNVPSFSSLNLDLRQRGHEKAAKCVFFKRYVVYLALGRGVRLSWNLSRTIRSWSSAMPRK